MSEAESDRDEARVGSSRTRRALATASPRTRYTVEAENRPGGDAAIFARTARSISTALQTPETTCLAPPISSQQPSPPAS